MKKKWKIVELKRFDRILLQVSNNDEIVGTITLDESDMESRELWNRAIEWINSRINKEVEL